MRIELIQQYYDSPFYLEKLKHKMEVLKQMEADEMVRIARMKDVYPADPVAFIEDCLMFKFVEFSGQAKPFFLFGYHKKIIRQLQEWELSGKDIEALIDKPRGMGVTWIISAYMLWRFLYTPNWSAFVLSRSEVEVDDGTKLPDNCIFGKIRWMMRRLPRYMIPQGFQFKETRGTATDMTLKLINPANGSSIIGSSTNSNAGRSRRYSFIFVDEAFAIEQFSELHRSLQSVARVMIFVSTVQYGFVFENFKKKADEQGTHIELVWSDHPFKDQQWYDEQLKKSEQMDDPDLLREVKPEYSVSSKVQYYPQIAEAKVEGFLYDRNYPLYVGLDFGGRQDYTALCFCQWINGSLMVLDGYWNTNKPTAWYAPFLNPELHFNPDQYSEPQQVILQRIRTRKKPVGYFGEQDHLIKRRPDNRSDQDALAPYGIRIRVNTYAIKHEPRRSAVASLLPHTTFNRDSDGAMKFYDAISNSRYTNPTRSTTEQLNPVHDPQIADLRASFENLCVNMGRIMRNQRGDVHNPSQVSFANAIIKSLRV